MPVAAESRLLVDLVEPFVAVAVAGVEPAVELEATCELIDVAERLRRLSAVSLVDVMQSVDRSGVYLDQGHASAKTMVVHLAKLSGGDGFRLDKIRRMVHGRAELIAECWRAGELGIEQAVVLAKVHANPRVRDRFVDDQAWFVAQAKKLAWPKFQRRIARWVELADDDGADPQPDPSHERRDASVVQDHFSQAWHLRAQFGSIDGSRFAEIFNAYAQAEFAADWEAAQAEHGDATCRDLLARTDAQRRADALIQMAEDAAANSSTSVRVKRVHNLVWQGECAEELFRRWNGEMPRPMSPDSAGVADLDGNSIHGYAAMADLVTGSFRRVVQNAASVVVDMSKDQRFFTGLARLGVELQATECYWHGCWLPTSQCQIDHLTPAARGGPTAQDNGGPACPRHNRLKEAGYTVTRLPDGTMHIVTPSGELVR